METLSAALVKHLMYTPIDPERQIVFLLKKILVSELLLAICCLALLAICCLIRTLTDWSSHAFLLVSFELHIYIIYMEKGVVLRFALLFANTVSLSHSRIRKFFKGDTLLKS